MIHSDKKHYVVFGTLALLIVLLVVANLFLGSVNIPAQEVLRILSGEEAEKASWTFYRLGIAFSSMHHGFALWSSLVGFRTDVADSIQ